MLLAGTAAGGTLAAESGRPAERRCQQIPGQGKISRTNKKEDEGPCSVYKTELRKTLGRAPKVWWGRDEASGQGRRGCAAREEPVPSTASLGRGQGHGASNYSTSPS